VHSYLADFDSEKQLYDRTGALTEYSKHWREEKKVDAKPTSCLANLFEQLFVDLIELDILNLEDLSNLQKWLLVLKSAGYQFTDVNLTQHRNAEELIEKYGFVEDAVVGVVGTEKGGSTEVL